MVEMEQGAVLASLRGYLEELLESGLDELNYGEVASGAVAAEATGSMHAGNAPVGAAPAHAAAAASIKVTGSNSARLLFVRSSDFAAPARELLAKMIRAMGFPMKEICVVTLSLEEGCAAETLRSAVLGRIAAVAPEAVVALGEGAAQFLLQSSEPIAKLRGRFIEMDGFQLMATLHPDELIADEGLKRQVWEELKQVMARLGA